MNSQEISRLSKVAEERQVLIQQLSAAGAQLVRELSETATQLEITQHALQQLRDRPCCKDTGTTYTGGGRNCSTCEQVRSPF